MKKIGNQEPTIRFSLPYTKSDGDSAIALYELTGRKALEWQKNLVNDILAIGDDGLWTHTRFGYAVPRQNGKGEILAIIELYALAAGYRVLHTAHLVSTSHKAWERLCMLLDDLEIDYYSIKAKGQEIIQLDGGGRVEFRTRTNKGGLGESYDILVIDEAQEYQEVHESALKYIISASPNPMTIMCGTPPTPISSGTVFKAYRTSVLSGKEESSGWAEWSVSEMSDVYNKDLWYATNPSLGIRVTERTVMAETGDSESKIIDFNIQRLGLWLHHNQQSAIQKADWERLLVDKLPAFTGKMDIGIKFGKSSDSVAMAIAVKTIDGRIFFEVIDCRMVRDGVEWIIDFLKTAQKGINKVIVDGDNGKQLIADAMSANKLKGCIIPSVREVIKAFTTFERGLFDGSLARMEQPTLTDVATNCEKRPIGTHGGFGYKSMKASADDTLLDAVVLATWAITEYTDPKIQKISY